MYPDDKPCCPDTKKRYYDGHRRTPVLGVGNETHEKFGFPLTVQPHVFRADPDFDSSSRMVIDHLGDLTGMRLADIGTGCGVIAIAAAFRNAAHVTACDIDPCAVDCARMNAQRNGVADRITILQSDVLDAILPLRPTFDVVIANLWFPVNHKGYENSRGPALDAYHRFLRDVRSVMNKNGIVYLTSSEFADVAATRALFAHHGITPHLTRSVAPVLGGTLDMESHLYSFGQDGQPKPPLFIPA